MPSDDDDDDLMAQAADNETLTRVEDDETSTASRLRCCSIGVGREGCVVDVDAHRRGVRCVCIFSFLTMLIISS